MAGFLATMPTVIASGQATVVPFYSPRLLGAEAILSAVQASAGNPGAALQPPVLPPCRPPLLGTAGFAASQMGCVLGDQILTRATDKDVF